MRLKKLGLCIILGILTISLSGCGLSNMMKSKTEIKQEEQVKNEEAKKEIYRIEKLIAQDLARKYIGVDEVTFNNYAFHDHGDLSYLGLDLTINNQKRNYTIIYNNDDDFDETGDMDKTIDNFYKKNTDKQLGKDNAKKVKIKYFYDRNKDI